MLNQKSMPGISANGTINQVSEKMQWWLQELHHYITNETGSITVDAITFVSLIDNTLRNLHDSIRDNEILLTTTIEQRCDFFGDYNRIQFVLLHLLSNAITFRDESKDKPSIDVTITTNTAVCFIKIKDNGLGMSDLVHAKMFEPFFRGSERSKGVGLGLFVVNSIIEKLGGTIDVSSELGQGSTFTILIPSSSR